MSLLLRPLSLLYGAGAAMRRALYEGGSLRRTRLRAPVLSVGNLSVGGSGKTPVVEALATMLQAAGHPVAILSRGYRGAFKGRCLVVSDGERVLSGPAAAGDEPVMLARALPHAVVAVGRDRAEAGEDITARFPGRAIILDDGFQHLRLERDLDLVCIDDETLTGRPLPEGRLREFPSTLGRAHVVIDFGDGMRTATPGQARVRARRVRAGFFDLDGQQVTAPARAYLVSAVARPQRFEDDVCAAGVEIAGHDRRRDHSDFGPMPAHWQRARDLGAAAIVTTDKNAVWLLEEPLNAMLPVMTLRIRAEFEDEASLRERVLAAVRKDAR